MNDSRVKDTSIYKSMIIKFDFDICLNGIAFRINKSKTNVQIRSYGFKMFI